MRKIKVVAALMAVGLLSGCYESEVPVLTKGEKTPLAGTFQCQNRINGAKTTHTFTEKRDGFWPFASYTYIDEEGSANLFRKASSGLLVGQVAGKNGRYTYGFVDTSNDKTFLVLAADVMGKGDYLDALLKKHQVEAKRGSAMNARLKGSESNIYDFLAAHDKSVLSVVMKCERTG